MDRLIASIAAFVAAHPGVDWHAFIVTAERALAGELEATRGT